ncbi:hypothetical protein J3F83DRAFT_742976 [Trichoderma novae-zelandiae]
MSQLRGRRSFWFRLSAVLLRALYCGEEPEPRAKPHASKKAKASLHQVDRTPAGKRSITSLLQKKKKPLPIWVAVGRSVLFCSMVKRVEAVVGTKIPEDRTRCSRVSLGFASMNCVSLLRRLLARLPWRSYSVPNSWNLMGPFVDVNGLSYRLK